MDTRRWLLMIVVIIGLSLVALGHGGEVRAESVTGARYQVFLPNISRARPAPVAQATLSGLVWADANGNGIQDLNEAGLAGIPVELETTPVAQGPNPISGSLTVLTNAEGRFYFTVYEDNLYSLASHADPSHWTPTTPTNYDFSAPTNRLVYNIGLQGR